MPFRYRVGIGTFTATSRAIEFVNDVLRSGRISSGPYVNQFERKFAAAHDCRFAIMTNSGTSSLTIALEALKIRGLWNNGDEVIVPSITFVSTINVVIQLNLTPIIVDVDPIFYEMDPSEVEKHITKKTRCIIPTHVFGHPCNMTDIMAIARARKLSVLEDSCEAMFSRADGISVGAFGDAACFSTYVAHLLTTGIGGLATTNDSALHDIMRSLAYHGRDPVYFSDNPNDRSQLIQNRFSFKHLGYSFRPSELEGALGLAQLETCDEMMRRRRANAGELVRLLGKHAHRMQLPTTRPGSDHAFMMFPIVLRTESKDPLVRHLENQGIETRDMLPIVNQPLYHNFLGISESRYPIAQWINRSGFYIGCHQDLDSEDLQYVAKTIDDFIAPYKGRLQNPQLKEASG